jgi:uncharacterized membrane protein
MEKFAELHPYLDLLFRWLHVFAGIIWIGHLYFFNFVNVPFQGTIDPPTKKVVNPQLIARALFWFRWGAMITFIAGVVLLVMNYIYPGKLLFDGKGGISARGAWMIFGSGLATIMWFNVWFVIWPAQKVILTNLRDGNPTPPELPKRALLFSRINSYLSGPMLFGMLAPGHFAYLDKHWMLLVAIALGVLGIWGNIRAANRGVGVLK